MKRTALAALAVALFAGAASADNWTWVPIKNDATLDAHLARADSARPNQMAIFGILEKLQVPTADSVTLAVVRCD